MRSEAHTADNSRKPLVGRHDELAELAAALNDAFAGHGRLVILGGDAGIGKTRLAEEAGARAGAAGAHIFWGRCWEGGGAPAYWPWIQVLRELLRSFELNELTAEVARIAEVLPELTSSLHFTEAQSSVENPQSAAHSAGTARLRVPDPGTGEIESARFRLFDAVSALLKTSASVAPIMIVLDDLHLADVDSLLLLKFVARDIRFHRVLIAGTRREVEIDVSPQQSAILSDVAREGNYIALRGLSESDTAAMVRRHTDVAVDDALLESLYRATEGNPFFVDEIVRLMVVEGKFRRIGPIDTAFRIPDSVRAAVHRRLTALPADARSALIVAATIGHEFSLVALARVSGTTIERAIDSLDHARRRAIIVDVPGVAERYQFTHAIVAESLRADLGMTDSMRLHQRIGEKLERIYGTDTGPHCAELAHHFSKAIALGTADKALRYAREGAERACAKLAYEEGVRLYQMALDAHSAIVSGPNAQRCELLIALGDAQSKDGDRDRAKNTFYEAAQIARGLKRADLLARVALQASAGMGTFFVVDSELVALLEEASRASSHDPAMRASLLACLGHELRWSERREDAVRLSRQAIELARKCGDSSALLSALWSDHDLSWAAENVDKRFAVADEIARLAVETGAIRWRLRAHETRLSAMLEIGDVAAADAELEAAEELRASVGQEFAVIDRFRVTRALMSGDFDGAQTLLFQLMAQAQRRQDISLITSFGGQLIMLHAEQGGLEEFESNLKGSVAQFPAMTAARCSLALFHARIGHESEARAELEILGREEFGLISRDWNWLGSLAICAEVCSAIDDASRAAILYGLLSDFANRNVTIGWGVICYGSVSRYLGLLATTMRKFEDAKRNFENAIRFELKMGARPFVARTRLCYAAMLFQRGEASDRIEASGLLRTALDAANALKMTALVRKANAIAAHAIEVTPAIAEGISGATAASGERFQRRVSTVMFLDIVGSTEHAARLGDIQWNAVIDQYCATVRSELKNFHGREINNAGDDFFTLFNEPGNAIRCACAIRTALLTIGLQIRGGIHTGECEIADDRVVGLAVHIGARVVRQAAPGQVMVTATVKDLVAGAGLELVDGGVHGLRGIPGEWRLFSAT